MLHGEVMDASHPRDRHRSPTRDLAHAGDRAARTRIAVGVGAVSDDRERRHTDPTPQVEWILFPDRAQDPEVVRAGQPRRDRAVVAQAHHREHLGLDVGGDVDGVGQERAHHPTELFDRHTREVRGREPLLRRGPVELVAHAKHAAVDEHGAGDRPGVTGRQLERHHRAPGVTDHDRAVERRPARDGQRVGRDVVEAVASVRLRTQAMPTRVERHHAEPSGERGHDPVPDALRRRQAMVQQQAGSIG